MTFKCNTPNCRANDFSSNGMTSTAMGWTPRHDANGRCLNTNPNTLTRGYTCNDCGNSYLQISKGYEQSHYALPRVSGDKPFHKIDLTPAHINEN